MDRMIIIRKERAERKTAMKGKKFALLLYITGIFLLLAGCGSNHEWTEATCMEPKTCSVCGETEGAPLGHTWNEATCTEPKTCTVCGITSGRANGHDWESATASSPKKCRVCGLTEGEVLKQEQTEEHPAEIESSVAERADSAETVSLPQFDFGADAFMARLDSAKERLPDGEEKSIYYWEQVTRQRIHPIPES